jgi:hypothetical protein
MSLLCSMLAPMHAGDFLTTTDEVPVHSFEVKAEKGLGDLEWTFPPSQVELVKGDGRRARQRTIPLPSPRGFGRMTFDWPLEPADAATVGLEAWEGTSSGAFTQTLRLR